MQQRVGDPITQYMHRVHNIKGIIEEWQPLRNAYVQRNNPSGCYKAVERAIQVHGCCHNSYVPLQHSHSKILARVGCPHHR
ncbi:unnamed protein product, partial [Vitis vinifera]